MQCLLRLICQILLITASIFGIGQAAIDRRCQCNSSSMVKGDLLLFDTPSKGCFSAGSITISSRVKSYAAHILVSQREQQKLRRYSMLSKRVTIRY
jgi:hypothetical protein